MKNKEKKNEKAEKAVEETDNLVLCSTIVEPEIKEKETKKKVRFEINVTFDKPMKANMMCTNDDETFISFMKTTWIGDLGASRHNANNDTGLYNITNINELVQGSLGSMSITKKGKLHMKVHQVH